MSEVKSASAFSPRTMLALVIVGLVSFCGLAVLSAYAPELRGSVDPGAHALSPSAVGYRGAVIMLQAEGAPAVASRSVPPPNDPALRVLTPAADVHLKDIKPFIHDAPVLVVLPKWTVAQDPRRVGFVTKVGAAVPPPLALLKDVSPKTTMTIDGGLSRPVLHGAGGPFAAGTYLPLGPIDRLRTVSGEDWRPVLADAQGRAVLVQSAKTPNLLVLVEPDLLNTQGLANIDTARAGLAILNAMRGDRGVRFDVTLNGFSRGQGLGRVMLEPPWLAATLCGVAAALLMGLHGLARFGPAQTTGRAIALGKTALVDNSAGLVRMARREAELAPAYLALTKTLVGQAAGGAHAAVDAELDPWLADLARLRGAAAPEELSAQAARAKTRDDLLALGRGLYDWRLEMTRERR